jgi:anti-sigma B factor antagonist
VQLEVSTTSSGDYTVLAVSGEVDMDSAPRLRELVLEQLTDGRNLLVIDMSGVTFMDSSGLSVLVAVLKRVRDGDGELRLVVTRERTMKLFRITSLDSVFTISGSLEDAINDVPLAAGATLPT